MHTWESTKCTRCKGEGSQNCNFFQMQYMNRSCRFHQLCITSSINKTVILSSSSLCTSCGVEQLHDRLYTAERTSTRHHQHIMTSSNHNLFLSLTHRTHKYLHAHNCSLSTTKQTTQDVLHKPQSLYPFLHYYSTRYADINHRYLITNQLITMH